MNKVWEIGDTCVLGRTSKVFWTVENIFEYSNGFQYGLQITRNYKGRTIKKVIATEYVIARKVA
jgi:hypothetical protein